MKKLSKFIVPGVIVLALLVAFYFLFMRPTGFTTPESVVSEFLSSMNTEECDTYFDTEMIEVCENFITLLTDEEVVVSSLDTDGLTVTAVLEINEVEATFTFIVKEVEPSTLEGIFTKSYYIIDTVH